MEGATDIGLCDGFVGHFQTMYDSEIYLVMHDALIEGLDQDTSDPMPLPPGAGDDESTDSPVDEEAGATVGCSTGGASGGTSSIGFAFLMLLAMRRRQLGGREPSGNARS